MSVFKLHPGANGILYRSAPEAKISFPLFDVGINSHDILYPQSFVDDEGTTFNAMSDFLCEYTGIYFEFKNGKLNGIKSKANALKASAAFDLAKANGYITKRNEAVKTIESSWSASATKFRLVQTQLAASGNVVVMIYDKKPEPETLGRLTRSKAFWCVFGDADWRCFMQFRTPAKYGFSTEFNIKGHQFTSGGGLSAQH